MSGGAQERPWGGWGQWSLEFGYQLRNYETTAPLFGPGQPLVLPSPNVQTPVFMDTKDSPLKSSLVNFLYCMSLFYHIIVLKGFKNKFEILQLLSDIEY